MLIKLWKTLITLSLVPVIIPEMQPAGLESRNKGMICYSKKADLKREWADLPILISENLSEINPVSGSV